MGIYAIHAPEPGDGSHGLEDVRAVKSGFSWGALIFGPVWLIARGLWLALLGYVVAAVVVVILASTGLLSPGAAFLLFVLGSLFLGVAGNDLRGHALARSGRPLAAVLLDNGAARAERTFLTGALARAGAATARVSASPRDEAGNHRYVPPEGPMSVAIVDYGSGNLHSAHKAFERAAREAGLDTSVAVTADPERVARADHIVLPGVGAFADCRRGLDRVAGMVDALEDSVRRRGRPFLGICVGMQLMASRGLEHEIVDGLDWIGGDVAPIKPADASLKIPHMGWNTLDVRRPHALLEGLRPGLHAYFVHSYQLYVSDPADVVAAADYGGPITAIVARDNWVGTQFHPEKSQTLGLALIANFLRWRP